MIKIVLDTPDKRLDDKMMAVHAIKIDLPSGLYLIRQDDDTGKLAITKYNTVLAALTIEPASGNKILIG